MPSRGSIQRGIRLPAGLWERFGEAAEQAGVDRSAVVREFIRWYLREAGARLPRRP